MNKDNLNVGRNVIDEDINKDFINKDNQNLNTGLNTGLNRDTQNLHKNFNNDFNNQNLNADTNIDKNFQNLNAGGDIGKTGYKKKQMYADQSGQPHDH
jgi:hypothetical protein